MSKTLVTPDTMTAAFTSLSSIQQDQFRSALFPTQGGNSGRFLTTNGSTVSWGTPTSTGGGSTGTVTSVNVTSTTGLTFTGGPITSSGTLTLGGVLSVANGGTGTTSISGLAAVILPAQSGNSGKFLTTNGSGALSWALPTSSGASSHDVDVMTFGAKGDGITDDSVAFQSAIDSLGTRGGVVRAVGKFRLTSSITVKPNVYLVGNFRMPGPGTRVKPTEPAAPYHEIESGSLRLESTATINIMRGAGIESLIVYRYGMVFPVAGPSAYAGTAVTIQGDDASVRACFITGFNKGVLSDGNQRVIVDGVFLDNTNGIEISRCYDISTVSNCHAWPFSTIQYGTDYVKDMRSGIAYHFHTVNDWGKVINCFSYGYKTGFKMDNVNNMVLSSCGTDSAWESLTLAGGVPTRDPWGALYVGTVGFHVSGTSDETVLMGCQSAAQEYAGVLIDTLLTDTASGTGRHTTLQNHSVWGTGKHCVLINSGHALINGSTFRGLRSKVSNSAIKVVNNQSRVLISGCVFKDLDKSVAVDSNVTTNAVEIRDVYIDSWTGTTNPYGSTFVVPVAKVGAGGGTQEHGVYIDTAASVMSITTTSARAVRVPTGANVGNIQWGTKGRELTLIFDGNSTIYNAPATGSSNGDIALAGSTNFVTSAGSVLTLMHDGTIWREVARNSAAPMGGGTGTGVDAGSATVGYLNYNGTTSAAGKLYGGTALPSGTARLNYGGNLYASEVFSSSEFTMLNPVGGTVHARDTADAKYTYLTVAGSVIGLAASGNGGTSVAELLRLENGTVTANANLVLNGTLKAGGSTGTNGQVLISTGTGVAWGSASGGGTGSVTTVSVSATSPITASVATATTTPSISISHAASGVTANSYGSRSLIPVVTVNGSGHVTSVSTQAVAGSDIFKIHSATSAGLEAVDISGTNFVDCWASAREWVFASNAAVSGATLRLTPSKYALVGYEASNGAYRLQVNGQIYATSSTIATSDGRYKQNVEPLTGALALVNALRPVSFDWKKHSVHVFPEGTTVGFIAQEVQEVVKDSPYSSSIIKSNTCTLEDGTTEEFMGIAEGNLIAILTAAVKEMSAQISELKTQVAVLEGRMN